MINVGTQVKTESKNMDDKRDCNEMTDFVRDFLDPVESSDVVEGVNRRRQATMETEYLQKKYSIQYSYKHHILMSTNPE